MSDNLPAVVSTAVVQASPHDDGEFVDEKVVENPWIRLHTLLYGRYAYAIVLGLILGACQAASAWMFIPVKHEVVGWVHIKPYLGKVLHQSDENGMLPSFDTFVSFQASLLQSQRVSNRAAQNPAWIAVGRKSKQLGASGVETDDLVIDHDKGSELITVTVTDRDEKAAAAAVKSILEAYLEISAETEDAGDAHRLQQLEDFRTSQANQVRGIHDRIQSIASVFGTDDLSGKFQAKEQEVETYEVEVQRIALDLSIAQAGPDLGPTTAPASQPAVAELTPEDIAATNLRMRDLLQQRDHLSLELAQLSTELGKNNRQVREKQSSLASVETSITDILADYQSKGIGAGTATLGGRGREVMSSSELNARYTYVKKLLDKAQAEALDLGRKNLELHDLKQQETVANQHLTDASARIEELNIEPTMASRISVLSDEEKPLTPLKSKRGPMTVAAGMGGLGGGFGIIILWGFLDRRVRSVLHVKQLEPAMRVLGVLPTLPDDLADEEQKNWAAHCVHQIRNFLDSGHAGANRVLAVTSPQAGDGKTSLTLALGLSFAAAGSRTLLVDCDMIGAGLTGRLNAVARRGIGSIMRRAGLLNEGQLKEALQKAKATNVPLAQVLIDLGFATESDIEQAHAASAQSSVGLLDALDGDPLANCITPILAKNLCILPLGGAANHHASQISPKAMRKIFDKARELFDVVIVDTGPILGSLEASIVVREVDEVILAVARDGRAPVARHAMKLLDSLGVRLAGIVFNRATAQDVAFVNYGSSSSTTSMRSTRSVRPENDPSIRSGRLGSLVAAVISSPGSESGKQTENHGPAH